MLVEVATGSAGHGDDRVAMYATPGATFDSNSAVAAAAGFRRARSEYVSTLARGDTKQNDTVNPWSHRT
ncbi:hypothetical protein JG687_00007138 [Phytophthora cactorum]|uniref:Uncharacterized protein n=1 Tax=Phytophthora cactorum TaxID=29920 RepID=A0A329T5Q7_9STRA|nr:hypothetical protein Pcac1_g10514 [Phytophthora cactorum]KAG2806245.1 hypothetical protein PC112_g17930 [Phytophthora cactorum]KAG2812107.1 hypothetical protein PC111_g14946 [Phytophthora cactorum]KAG2972160.1 hypothetical protein PC118_g15844 [Phytophthora cactorum]KAG3004732.1 hypothetical protein PC120_g18382 [Phytophthora cactorum]